MSKGEPGARWQQLRGWALSTTQGKRDYLDGYRQAESYKETMRVLDAMRRALGISQSELASRIEKSQSTVARLLTHGENPTLASLEEVLRGLGLHGRLVIEAGRPGEEALTVEVGTGAH